MPFRNEDTSAFGPEDLEILHDVFDLAWQRLLNEGFEGDDDQLEEARRRLAKCIMANAVPGDWMSKCCLRSVLIDSISPQSMPSASRF